MRLYKNDILTVRLNPILKSKFNIAIWFLSISEVLSRFIQDYVRDFEKQFWVIEVSVNKDTQYDIITKMYWVKIDKQRFKRLIEAYPKTRKNTPMYWN